MVDEQAYLSAVHGRQHFRQAFRREREKVRQLREALDRIARFDEALVAVTQKRPSGLCGEALAAALGEYARKTLAETT